MICSECNTKNKKDAKICTNCGAKLEKKDETNIVRTKDRIVIKPRKKNNLVERSVEEVIGEFEPIENVDNVVIDEIQEPEQPIVEEIPEVIETPEEVLDIPDVLTIDNSLNESSPLDNIDSLQIDESLSTLEVEPEEQPEAPVVDNEPTPVVETPVLETPIVTEQPKEEVKVEEQKVVKSNKKSSNLPYLIIGCILTILLIISIALIIYTKRG